MKLNNDMFETRNYRHVEPFMVFAVTFLIASAICVLAGCVSGNKAEVNAIKIEKQSTAKEVDQYVETSGKVLRFVGFGK